MTYPKWIEYPVIIKATQDDIVDLMSNGELRYEGEIEEGDEIWFDPRSGEVFVEHRDAYECCGYHEDRGPYPDYEDIDWTKDPNYASIKGL